MDSMQDSTTNDPMQKCMDMLDRLIQNGGASAEELKDLKMDLEDYSMGESSEPSEPDTNDSGPQGQQDVAGMIDHMQRGA